MFWKNVEFELDIKNVLNLNIRGKVYFLHFFVC